MSFTEKNLVPKAGLLPDALLAQRIGLAEVVDERLRLAVQGANSRSKALTVIGSMLARGDSIDHRGAADRRPPARRDGSPTLPASNRTSGGES